MKRRWTKAWPMIRAATCPADAGSGTHQLAPSSRPRPQAGMSHPNIAPVASSPAAIAPRILMAKSAPGRSEEPPNIRSAGQHDGSLPPIREHSAPSRASPRPSSTPCRGHASLLRLRPPPESRIVPCQRRQRRAERGNSTTNSRGRSGSPRSPTRRRAGCAPTAASPAPSDPKRCGTRLPVHQA